MDKVTELLQQRAETIEKMRKIIDQAEEEDRGPNTDEKRKIDNMEETVDDLESRIEGIKKVREREKKEILNEGAGDDNRQNDTKNRYDQVFESYVRRGFQGLNSEEARSIKEKRAQNIVNATKGGYLVPETWANTIIEKLDEQNVMRQLATVETTSLETNIPVSTSKPTFGWIDEEGTYAETDEDFGQKSVDAWKAGGIIKISEELLYDNQYNLQGRVSTNFAQAASDIQEEAFVAGDGVMKPRGIILDSEEGHEASSGVSGVDFDDVIELVYSVKRPYRRNGAFLMHDDTAKNLRKLKSNDNVYHWQVSVQAGEPDSIFGYPVYISADMPEWEDNKKGILFGDFGYYHIFDRQGLFMQRLDEKYADTGQVGFRAYMRTDGLLTLAEAVKHLNFGA